MPVTLPSVPGHYRLTVTLHDGEGEAYDDATQALLPSLHVRVTGDYDMAIDVVPAAQLTTRQEALLGIRVTNIGKLAWGHGAVNTPSGRNVPAQAATVVGRWLPLSPGAALDADPTTQETDATLGIPFASGQKADSILGLTAPSTPGDYLLLLDVVTPERGSLVALGADPTLVRITVVAPG